MQRDQHLIFGVPIFVVFVRYFSYQSTLLSPYLGLFLVFSMIGSYIPDIDWKLMWLGLRHRSPITHSFFIPLVLFGIVWYLKLPTFDIAMLCYQAFLIGMATHLLGDNIKTGNLVKVPARFEKWWYFAQGGVVLGLLFLTGFFNLEGVV